jgi:hypothetical protein
MPDRSYTYLLLFDPDPRVLRIMQAGLSQIMPNSIVMTASTRENADEWRRRHPEYRECDYELYSIMRDAAHASTTEEMKAVMRDMAAIKGEVAEAREIAASTCKMIDGSNGEKGVRYRLFRIEIVIGALLLVTTLAVGALIKIGLDNVFAK